MRKLQLQIAASLARVCRVNGDDRRRHVSEAQVCARECCVNDERTSPVHTPKRRNVATAADDGAVPLQSESDANACECVIMVRLLNGQRIKCGFAASATLADLYRYVSQHGFGGKPTAGRGFALTLQLPTRVFSGEQLAQDDNGRCETAGTRAGVGDSDAAHRNAVTTE
jgi:hypothetical protein